MICLWSEETAKTHSNGHVKSISLSRKNTIQSSENFVGTDWIFQQILSISAAKHVDGWIKGPRSVNEIFQILFGVRVKWNATELHGKFQDYNCLS